METIIYPRHYTTRSDAGEGVILSSGDSVVEALYDLYVDRGTNTTSWAYRKRVLECALRLFGNFPTWYQEQLRNPAITGHNAAFLNSILNFVNAGKTDLDVHTWLELMDEARPTRRSSTPTRVLAKRVTPVQIKVSADFVQKWIAQPNGVEHLLCTLHALFGRARSAHL